MGKPAFQLEDPVGASGAYGVDPYGTCAYGGSDATPYVLPNVHLGSDRITERLRIQLGGPVHVRHGLVIGERVWAERGIWQFVYDFLPRADIDSFLVFFRARTFRFIPDHDTLGTFWRVLWLAQEYRPEYLRNGLYRLSFVIQEVPLP